MEHRSTFDVFRSEICHEVKCMGDIEFIIYTLESGRIRHYFDKGWYPESLYLLAMVDYLSSENSLALCREFSDIRLYKLAEPLFPLGIVMADVVMKSSKWKDESMRNAIPEFVRFNIVEGAIRDVV